MLGGTPFRIIETVEGEGMVRLALAGELDLATRSAFQRRLLELSSCHTLVQLDLSRLEFVDASGLTALIGAIRNGAQPALGIEIAPQVSRLLSAFGYEFG